MWQINNFVNDLGTLEDLIKKHDIPVDSTTISILKSELDRKKYTDDSTLSHKISDLEFTLKKTISGTIPYGINNFSFLVDINFILDPTKNVLNEDPFFNDKTSFKGGEPIDAYSFQLEIRGQHNNEEYNNFWHLDRHISGGGDSKVSHPFYHFQNGGNKLEDANIDNGKVILMGAPRIPHPPMDVFLAFHFILTNFFNKNDFESINSFLIDDDYIDIISRAQERMLKPYYGVFNSVAHKDYTVNNITPLYFSPN